MKSLLEVERRPFPADPSPQPGPSRRTRWIVGLAAGALCAAALGYLIVDQAQARTQYARAHASLSLTQQRSRTVTTELREASRDLSVLKTQVTQQASLITSLQTCLVGVEQALNELAVGNQSRAIAALNGVSTSCTAAEASSG